jgi:hypothetical protein
MERHCVVYRVQGTPTEIYIINRFGVPARDTH